MDLASMQARYAALGLKPLQFSYCLTDDGFTPPQRVVAIDRGWCSLVGLDELGQEVLQRVRSGVWELAVGDWLLLAHSANETAVTHVLERTTHLRRATQGDSGQQWIAVNLDTIFVVAAFAPTEKLERRSVNARRIERYLSAIQEGGATPVVILNKLDIASRDRTHALALCEELANRFSAEVVAISAIEGHGLSALAPYLEAGDTVAFVGPSGVGKSTLINALTRSDGAATSEVRPADMKGKHTTTRRELIRIPAGAFLVDTPGMREFSVLLENDVVPGFDDIEAIAARCRFNDCQHETEPGCAVLEALTGGALEPDRLKSYRSIRRDGQRMRTKRDAGARHAERKAGRKLGAMIKEAKALKNRKH